MFNGHAIKLKQDEEITSTTEKVLSYNEFKDTNEKNKFVQMLLQNYFKLLHKNETQVDLQSREDFRNRKKRSIDLHDMRKKFLFKKSKFPQQSSDNSLFVEIKTHIDSKQKLDKKKKIILHQLINKIEKAITPNEELDPNVVNQNNKIYVHIKKRDQSPINVNKNIPKYKQNLLNNIEQKSQIYNSLDEINRDIFKKYYKNPDVMYNGIEIESLRNNNQEATIFKRQQSPLDSASDNEKDLKYFQDEVDGSGFTVGFSQYVAEEPDPEYIKLFTNLENLIQTYHQNYDNSVGAEENNVEYKRHKRNVLFGKKLKHKNNDDYHYSEYNVIFDNKPINIFSYNKYEDIYNDKKDEKKISDFKDIELNITALNKIVKNKNLNPSEILTLASLINDRKKRHIILSNIPKRKTQSDDSVVEIKPLTKELLKKLRRCKRNVEDLFDFNDHSKEDVLLVSNEHVYADRAIVKDSQETANNEEFHPHLHLQARYNPDNALNNFFDNVRTSQNKLMNRYPHIILDDISKSREKTNLDEHNIHNIVENNFNFNNEHFSEVPNEYPKSNYKVTVKIIPKNNTDDITGFREVQTSINKTFNKNGLAYISQINIKEISKVEELNKSNANHKAELSNKIFKEKQETLKQILKAQKVKINAQLLKLEHEKQKIDKIIGYTTTESAIDELLTYSPKKASKQTNIIDRDYLTNFEDTVNIARVVTTTTTSTTPCPKNTESYPKTSDLLEKIDKNTEVLEKILKSIERNQVSKTTERTSKINQVPNTNYIGNDLRFQENPYIIQYSQPKPHISPLASILYHGMVYNNQNNSNNTPTYQYRIPNTQNFRRYPYGFQNKLPPKDRISKSSKVQSNENSSLLGEGFNIANNKSNGFKIVKYNTLYNH